MVCTILLGVKYTLFLARKCPYFCQKKHFLTIWCSERQKSALCTKILLAHGILGYNLQRIWWGRIQIAKVGLKRTKFAKINDFMCSNAELQQSFEDLWSSKIFVRWSIFVFIFGPFPDVEESLKLRRFEAKDSEDFLKNFHSFGKNCPTNSKKYVHSLKKCTIISINKILFFIHKVLSQRRTQRHF